MITFEKTGNDIGAFVHGLDLNDLPDPGLLRKALYEDHLLLVFRGLSGATSNQVIRNC